MTKTPEDRPPRGPGDDRRGDDARTSVRDSSGSRHPFLRGMVTHDLLQRGLSFDEAYAAARAVGARLAGRREVTTAELKVMLESQLEGMLGPERLRRLVASGDRPVRLEIADPGEAPQPFSRGLLARSIHAAGPDLDRAYELVAELEGELQAEGRGRLDRQELARRAGDLLERAESREVAAQYRLVRSIQRLPRPVVIYLGGASGTGKSTLAVDLAPLLRIYRITATDTIRQVMRMVFSPAILPAIHRSSFEGPQPEEHPFLDDFRGSPRDGEYRQRLTSTFEEQATRVCVGVRAVVERALDENMSLIVEGVHLVPPLVPFPDLEGAASQVAIMLTTLDEEVHRTRFLARARTGGRRAERYLESFEEIRLIQDLVLQKADRHDTPILETTNRETTSARALRLVTGVLQQRYPRLLRPAAIERPRAPTLLLALDGLPDRPLRALGGRTPLQAAATPHLDRLAREGRCGLADPVAPGVVPDTASGSLALFGQSPGAMKRGAVEAIGAGMEPTPGDVALRGNFATLDARGRVVDRRAGRIRDGGAELAAAIDRLAVSDPQVDPVDVRVRVSTEHRLAIVLRGQGLSSAIVGSDPGDGAPIGPPLVPRPLDPDDEAAVYTARVLALFEEQARQILERHPVNEARVRDGLPPANAVLTRGAGRIHRLLPLEEAGLPLKVACVSGDHTLLGLARWMGAETITSPRMTANLDTDLGAKFDAALDALRRCDLVVLHLKGADIAAHDRRSDLKVKFIERVDRSLGGLLERHPEPLRVAVASDHGTLSEVGQHSVDPVPVLIWGPDVAPDGVERFDEQAASSGALRRFPLQMLLERVFEEGGEPS